MVDRDMSQKLYWYTEKGGDVMRKHFINNMRWLCVLWLIPYHAAVVFNDYPKVCDFYVLSAGGGVRAFGDLVIVSAAWMMPLLFAVAGTSACYALSKRTPAQFVKERVLRLLVPLLLCTVLLAPVQTYFAELSHNSLAVPGNYFEQLLRFFTTEELTYSGYRGGFTFANFWFIRYLFYMSLLALPAMIWYKRKGQGMQDWISKLSVPVVAALFILPAEALFFAGGNTGYNFLEYTSYFLLGFFVLSNEDIQEKLRKWRWPLAVAAVGLAVLNLCCKRIWFHDYGIVYSALYRLLRWVSILAIFGLSRQYLDRRCRVTDYLTDSSYSIYLVHQSCLVAIAYYVIQAYKFKLSQEAQYFLIVGLTIIASFVLYEIIRRIPGLRMMLGYKKKAKQTTSPPNQSI